MAPPVSNPEAAALALPQKAFASPHSRGSGIPKPDDMTIRIPRWLVPVMTTVAMGLAGWLTHLTLTLSEVLQAQARGEHLFASHTELRLDVKEQAAAMSDVRESLARIEAMLDRPFHP